MRFGSGSFVGLVGDTRQDVPISSSQSMYDKKELAIANISPVIDSQGRDKQIFREPDCTKALSTSKAPKPDIREANRSHMRVKRTSDEAYRQRERILSSSCVGCAGAQLFFILGRRCLFGI